MDTPTIVLSLALAALLSFFLVLVVPYRQQSHRLPPGPPGHWLFGNKIPHPYAWRKFEEYTHQYGDIFSLRLGSRILIVVGTYQAALELMEKQSVHFADRPRAIAAGETLSGGMRTLLVPYGDRLKRLRKALHAYLQPKMAGNYEPLQERTAKTHLLDILANPAGHQEHAKRYAATLILSVAYGRADAPNASDPEVRAVNTCLNRLGMAARPGAYLVDTFPWLKYVPGYLSQLRAWHQEELTLFGGQLDNVRRKIAAGEDVPPSFAKYVLEHQVEYGLTNDEAAYLVGSIFGAGSETTAAGISIIVMTAATQLQAQKAAQAELDLVVGRSRPPSFADRDSLPYISAFELEMYRWRTVSAGGFLHKATKDVEYRGFLIPAGASIVAPHWSVHRDPAVFPDPDKFMPERWLTKEGTIREDLRTFMYGYGRRVCPGQHVAHRSIWINTAMLLWAFNISQDPKAPIDTLAFSDTTNSRPLPFQALFEPRVGSAEQLQEILAQSE